MEDSERDIALTRLFHAAFSLSQRDEDAFWQAFQRRSRADVQLWESFGRKMLDLNRQLQPALRCLHTPLVQPSFAAASVFAAVRRACAAP